MWDCLSPVTARSVLSMCNFQQRWGGSETCWPLKFSLTGFHRIWGFSHLPNPTLTPECLNGLLCKLVYSKAASVMFTERERFLKLVHDFTFSIWSPWCEKWFQFTETSCQITLWIHMSHSMKWMADEEQMERHNKMLQRFTKSTNMSEVSSNLQWFHSSLNNMFRTWRWHMFTWQSFDRHFVYSHNLLRSICCSGTLWHVDRRSSSFKPQTLWPMADQLRLNNWPAELQTHVDVLSCRMHRVTF